MSGSIQSLRHRIEGAGDLEAVVRAMKALAASSIGQYERAVASLNDYYRTVELGLSVCLREAASATNIDGRGPIGAVVFGSDQGLVGRFNEVVVDFAHDTLNEILRKHPGPKHPGTTHPEMIRKYWAVGERAHSLLADAGSVPVALLKVPTSVRGITQLVGRLLIDLGLARDKGEVVNVYVFHNRPKPGAVCEPVYRRLLPLDTAWQNKVSALPWPSKIRPEVIGEPAPALDGFIRGYLFMLLFQACAESLNSENASRLSAMQRAEKNIGGILENLNREFDSVRQASIDEELFDVVSGFEALAGRKS